MREINIKWIDEIKRKELWTHSFEKPALADCPFVLFPPFSSYKTSERRKNNPGFPYKSRLIIGPAGSVFLFSVDCPISHSGGEGGGVMKVTLSLPQLIYRSSWRFCFLPQRNRKGWRTAALCSCADRKFIIRVSWAYRPPICSDLWAKRPPYIKHSLTPHHSSTNRFDTRSAWWKPLRAGGSRTITAILVPNKMSKIVFHVWDASFICSSKAVLFWVNINDLSMGWCTTCKRVPSDRRWWMKSTLSFCLIS